MADFLTGAESSSTREAPNKAVRGSKQYKEMVDRGVKEADKKNLPFSFSKPKKPERKSLVCECPFCRKVSSYTKNTVMVICCDCNNLFSVDEKTIVSR